MFIYENWRFNVNNIVPDVFEKIWKIKEKINKKPICLRLFKYLIIGTLVRHITTNIIAKNEPNRMKLLKGIKIIPFLIINIIGNIILIIKRRLN